jgi:molecular chaperone GrpE
MEEKEREEKEEKQNQSQKEAAEALEKNDYALLWDKYLRLQAEFDNYRKRSFKERGDFIKFANESLILELLNILDDFERGIKSAEQKKDYQLLHQGVDMISRQLHTLLESKGLSRIKSLGQKFDPHYHEAMEVVEKESGEEGEVIEELQPGYLLNGRIVRPARVKVIKAKEEKE